ncbi:c-type cytochrome [Thalassotalea castellviae]|uniref:Cytochrome c n=1 Tax=Thalassotalea castellviae TaxID=3075612 RepID=A0ABU3A472_9GAMM|nr:cytochrome c [Thalassotalea sp. W431]MDT0603913.1 cytochrome c [Thalassotalea sp. W431]
MNLIKKTSLACALILSTTIATAEPAKSEKHAKKATELRQSIFALMGSNMGPLGGMAKGKMPFDVKAIEKHALRINQLSFMIADYTSTDTSKYEVKTEALNKVWQERDLFVEKIADLNKSSAHLMAVVKTGDEGAIKKAIGGVGKTCGGCHDVFKKD